MTGGVVAIAAGRASILRGIVKFLFS